MRIFVNICLMVVALVATSSFKSGDGVEVKVMTYNIYSVRNASNEAIATIIKKHNPDVVSLQEVERYTDLNPGDVPAQIAKLAGMKYVYFVHALDLKKGDYGNAILSKYPILESESIKLGTPGVDYMRAFGYVKIEKEGKAFYFGTTHLDHLTDSLRLKQTAQILQKIKDIQQPFLLAGDFNSRPESPVITAFEKRFTLARKKNELEDTAPAPQADYTIDYILFSPASEFSVSAYKVDYQAGAASDHFPVVGVFKIK